MRKFFVLLLVMTAFFFFTANYRAAGNAQTQWLLKSSPSFEKNIGSSHPEKHQQLLDSSEIPQWIINKNYSVLATFKDKGTQGYTAKDQAWKSLTLILDLIVLIGWPIYLASIAISVFRELLGRILKRSR